MTILVTAFSAPEGKLNASDIVLQSLINDGHPSLNEDDEVIFKTLDTDLSSTQAMHESLTQSLVELIYENRPSVCVFLGQAPGRSKITLERIGTNYFLDRRIIEDGPVGYWSNLPCLEELPQILNSLKVPAAHSNCAGSTMCNHVLYSALHLAETQSLPLGCGFVHMPLVEEQSAEEWANKPHLPLNVLRDGVAGIVRTILDDETN